MWDEVRVGREELRAADLLGSLTGTNLIAEFQGTQKLYLTGPSRLLRNTCQNRSLEQILFNNLLL